MPVHQLSSANDMPEYSNLPQPRTQASLASAAANAATSMSFNSKRSRHSSLWSLEDEADSEDANDMVNYANDPFGVGHTTNAEYAIISRADSEAVSSSMTGHSGREGRVGISGLDNNPRTTASSFSQTRHASASNEALN